MTEPTQTDACPDENTLVQFAGGTAGARLAAVETHLDGCEACRRSVAAAASEQTLPPALLPAVTLSPGVRVGRYQIERELGRGGMGIVYMARDVTLDRRVALKLLHARRHEEAQARLLREAQVMAKLAHPNVVPVFELGEWRNEVFLVMELVNGVTLESWLKAAKHPASEILSRFLDAGRGLAAAHAAGVVHRDFKPANVLVGLDGRVRVTDFGLSRPGPALELPPHASPLLTRDGAIIGTLAYMSPEQIDGKAADERSDQFAFCVALTEALTGQRPFEGESWSSLSVSLSNKPRLGGGVSPRLRAVLRRGLERDPSRRFLSMTGLLTAIDRTQQTGWRSVAVTCVAAIAIGLFASTRPQPAPVPAPVALEDEGVPIVAAAVDIPEGTVVTFDMLVQRTVPRRYVTSSVVKPDSASYIINERTRTPFQQGDPLVWSAFQPVVSKP